MVATKQDTLIRVGDLVKVQVPRFVARVGYPKSVEDYARELEANPAHQQLITDLFRAITGDDQVIDRRVGRKHRCRYRVERELAYLMAKRDGFGGPERSIHFVEYAELEGMECTVMEVRAVNTGRYYPPSGGWGGWEDDSYEPGGLGNMKQHRIVRVNLYAPRQGSLLVSPGQLLEVPVAHLKKLRDARDVVAGHGDIVKRDDKEFRVVCRVPAGTSIYDALRGLGVVLMEPDKEYRQFVMARFDGPVRQTSRADRYVVCQGNSIPRLKAPQQSLAGFRFYVLPVRGTRVLP